MFMHLMQIQMVSRLTPHGCRLGRSLVIVNPEIYLEKTKRAFWRVMRIDALIFIGLISYLIIEGL